VIDLIRGASRHRPDAPAIVSPNGTRTYGELLEQAERLARGLAERDLARVACVVTDPAALIAVLAATSAIGCEACTYPPLLDDAGIDALATTFGHTVVLTDRDLHLAGAQPVRIDELETGSPTSEPTRRPTSMPLLVLTSGTTAKPKAARHAWDRLAAPALRRAGSPDERWLLAFNLNQFAGLQVLLHVLASGATIVIPRSIQPRDALDAMLEHGVTHLSATPTFWRFLVALLDGGSTPRPDLVQATLGGEAASDRLLEDVRRLFPRARVSHIYASTEVGSGVSVGDGRPGLPLSVLDRRADADVQFRIVEGQLEAKSAVGMLGYHAAADADAAEVEDGWRATGDLVEVRGDRIHFVGRASETINVGGVKVHPLSVEDLVGRVPGVVLSHAYGRSNPVSGQIVVLDVVNAPGADRDAVEDAVRAACEVLPPAARPRRVRFVDEVELKEHKVVRASAVGEPST
jgi:acyl-CoA synthetase (AMP-forming)/AMP-acid ligase II